jgi:hypothetical protein
VNLQLTFADFKMFILRLIFASVVVAVCWFWWSRRRFRELANRIPGPKGLPLIGNVHKFFAIKGTGIIPSL